jgi:hypothetical protein
MASSKAAARAQRREPPAESSVYDGRRLLGTIKPGGRAFVARDAGGKRLGEFDDARSAMRRICDAARDAEAENVSA